jgi:hypothetical protein
MEILNFWHTTYTAACTTHELRVFEHSSAGASSLFSVVCNPVEVAPFPSNNARERSWGVVGRSNTSPTECTVDDEDDGCTTPTGMPKEQQITSDPFATSAIRRFCSYIVMPYCHFWGGCQCFWGTFWVHLYSRRWKMKAAGISKMLGTTSKWYCIITSK